MTPERTEAPAPERTVGSPDWLRRHAETLDALDQVVHPGVGIEMRGAADLIEDLRARYEEAVEALTGMVSQFAITDAVDGTLWAGGFSAVEDALHFLHGAGILEYAPKHPGRYRWRHEESRPTGAREE